MAQPKLIMLSGFPASGKTTIGKLYLKDHPLALFVEGDEIIVNLGQWLQYEPEASHIVRQHVRAMIRTQLTLGYDVVWPFLLNDAADVSEVETLAQENGGTVHEFLLDLPREAAIARLMERGVWGEAGLPPIGDEELPRINELYDKMVIEMNYRPNAIKVDVGHQSPIETYQQILGHLNQSV